ncbi:MAG: fimbrillin family protein [Bacteroidales bacterium]|nr:fimbrillin family protein [Bacteroidales bacterium]
MKKVLFFAAILGGVLAGCSKNEIESSNPQLIAFNTPVVGNATKAAVGIIENKIYPDDRPFDVWALYSEAAITNLSGYDAATKTNYFEKKTFTYNNGAYAYTANAYWPKKPGAKLTFHALSPVLTETVAHQWVATSAPNNFVGFKVTGYSVEDDAASQRDLMYSDIAFDKTSSDEAVDDVALHSGDSYTGVDITFRHALASIRFKVKLAAEDISTTKYQIKKIYLYGHKNKGDFLENLNTNGTASEPYPTWTATGSEIIESAKKEITLHQALTDVPVDGTELNLYTAGTGTYIVMPQDLTRVNLYVEYTEKVGDLTATDLTKTIPLTNLGGIETGDAEATKNNWIPNRRYTYTLVISRDQIKLDPAVANWTDVEVTLPTNL